MTPDRIVALGISQVPEGRRIFFYLTVLENLDMGTFLRKDTDGIKEDMDYIFELFPILGERRHQAGGTLSGGEQNANLALKVADRGYVMETGAITMTDTSANLMANEDVKKAYLGI